MNKSKAAIALAIATGAVVGIATWKASSHFDEQETHPTTPLQGLSNSAHEGSGAAPIALPARVGRVQPALPDVSRTTEIVRPSDPVDEALKVTFDGRVVSVNGVDLSELNIESWSAEELSRLRDGIRPLQVEVYREIVARVPVEHLFITNEEYTQQRRWHEDMVFYAAERSLPEGSEHETEYGVIQVPQNLSPESYLLSDAIVRSYRAPASAQELMDKGIAYEATVLKRHPDATADITDDLTRWTYFSPDGKVVGMMAYAKFGNN